MFCISNLLGFIIIIIIINLISAIYGIWENLLNIILIGCNLQNLPSNFQTIYERVL